MEAAVGRDRLATIVHQLSPVEAAESLKWVDALPGGSMPAHQYVVFNHGDPGLAVGILLATIERHPSAYDAYFRGYQRPMRYVELTDDLRYWRTVLNGTHMLNRCTLDSVEPPRRVDQGAMPMPWQGPPWAPFGSPWPPGYLEVAPGRYRYDRKKDWRWRHRCVHCGDGYFLSSAERPCPHCGLHQGSSVVTLA